MTTTVNMNGLTGQLSTILREALAALEKFTGPEIDALKASAKDTMDKAVAASGPIGIQIFNVGLESFPGVKIIAPAIEVVADPIVGNLVHAGAQALDNEITADLNKGQLTTNPPGAAA
jgi:hypothetical protein